MQDSQLFPLKRFDGGVADRNNSGVRGSYAFGYGINLRDGLSTLTPNQALKKDSGTTIDELIHFFITASDGNLYAFGDAGGIYQRTPGGAWSKLHTDPDGAILGAMQLEYNDGAGNYIPHLVWATQTKVKSEALANIGTPSPTTEFTFHRGNAGDWHTMIPALGVGMICDGDYLAMIDYEGATNTQALQLPYGTESQALLERNYNVVIGAIERSGQERGWLYTWDKVETSWIQKKDAQVRGVNSMNFFESGMLISGGDDGALNYWDTANYFPLKQIPGGGNINPDGMGTYKGVPHFGVNNGNHNGIWSYGRTDKNTSYALNLEYLVSPVANAGDFDAIRTKMADGGVEIGAVTSFDGDLFASWKDGSTYGVDTIDHNNKAKMEYESIIYDADHPESEKIWRMVKLVATDRLPTGTKVEVAYKTNNDADWQEINTAEDNTALTSDDYKAMFPMEGNAEECQIRLRVTPNGNDAPDIRSINTFFRHLGVT